MNGKDIKTIALFGAGTIGGGFAAYFSLKGLKVNVYVRSEESVERAHPKIQDAIDSYLKYDIVKDGQKIWDNINITTNPAEAFTGVYFVQENGAEKLEQKHKMIALMEQYLPVDAVIASSSSGMSVTEMAAKAVHPERIIVAHPFNPSYLIPLLEICKGEKTSEEAVQIAVDFYRSTDKVPIVMLKERKGYIANRLAHALWREEIAMVTEGVCTLDDAECAICYGPGLRWAIMGLAMSYELSGGELGLRGCAIKFAETSNEIFEDLSKMDKVPDSWPDIADEQIKAVMANMPDFVGHTKPEIAAFRDYMLVEELKMHRKL